MKKEEKWKAEAMRRRNETRKVNMKKANDSLGFPNIRRVFNSMEHFNKRLENRSKS